MHKLKINEARTDEVNGLLHIFNEARSSTTGFENRNTDLEYFLKDIKGERIYVISVNNSRAGFLSIWEQENFIHHLYILPEFQNEGLGKALIEECVRRHGLPLSLKCLKANERACAFYEKNGWRAETLAEGPEGPYVKYQLKNA
ncbi:MAG: GNAT family N-acetyltransferase [Gammaproteobacteria bacterium]|jgi:GNAT superfamily N-acetyltransferase